MSDQAALNLVFPLILPIKEIHYQTFANELIISSKRKWVIMALQDARSRLREHFSGPPNENASRWSKLWDTGDFLPFDRGMPNPALVDLLTDRHDLIGDCFIQTSHGQMRKKALVPGCGRGG